MSISNIIRSLNENFINEELKSYIVTYREDGGEEKTSTTSGTSDSDARRRFEKSKEGRDIRVVSVVEDSEDDLDENSTANLDGGAGQPKVPHAFQRNKPSSSDKKKEKENATSSTGYNIANVTSNYTKRKNEIFNRISNHLDNINNL